MKDQSRDKSFFELLPKGKLLAALSLLVVLVAVMYVQRHLPSTMEHLKAMFAAPAPSRPETHAPRVRIEPPPPGTVKRP